MEFNARGRDAYTHDVDTLNDLIETTIDSVEGYEDAAKEAQNSRFKMLFGFRAEQRRAVLARLQEQVRQLGGVPEDRGSMLAAAHRMFLDIKSAMTPGDDTVLDEVERGEDVIKSAFERASRDEALAPETRQLIEQLHRQIRDAHDEVHQLRNHPNERPSMRP